MFHTFLRTFTPQENEKIETTNLIYDKTLYVQLQNLPKPGKFYTIPDGADGDILQVWGQLPGNT